LIEGAASGTKDVNSRDEADVIADTDKPADTDGADSDERPFDATLTHNMFVSRTEITQRQWRAASGGSTLRAFRRRREQAAPMAMQTPTDPWKISTGIRHWRSPTG
jgi:hypothetical protein